MIISLNSLTAQDLFKIKNVLKQDIDFMKKYINKGEDSKGLIKKQLEKIEPTYERLIKELGETKDE